MSKSLPNESRRYKRIQEIQPKAYVTHCHCHFLSLSVKDAIKGSKILSDAMDITKEVIQLIKLSPKREHMLSVIKENLERETDGNKEMEPSLVNSVLLDGQ